MRGEYNRAAAVNSLPKGQQAAFFNLCLKLSPSKPPNGEQVGEVHSSESYSLLSHSFLKTSWVKELPPARFGSHYVKGVLN